MRSARLLWYFSQLAPVSQEEVSARLQDVASSEGFIQAAAKASEVFREVRREETQQHFERDVRNGHIKSLALENGLRDATSQEEAETIVRSVMGPIPLWRDDQLRGRLDLERHYKSSAYRELHQRYVPQSGMGLYGGEPGFEGSPRMHVDPDRPHVPSIHVVDKINGTLRYAKYGLLKHELNIIDVDKLIRHGRRLPPPEKLYADLRFARRALSDANCAALLRYQRQRIGDRSMIGQRRDLLRTAKEMFEQMLVVTIPPADAGPESHAEMIRCSAMCGEFNDAVRRRAIRQMERNPERFVLTASFFDAVLEACVLCNRIEDGLDTFYQLLSVNLRPLQSSLDHVLALLAQSMMPASDAKVTSLLLANGEDVGVQVEYIQSIMERTTQAFRNNGTDHNAVVRNGATELEDLPSFSGVMDKVDEVWALYEFFEHKPSPTSVTAYLQCLSLARIPEQVQLVLEYAEKNAIRINEDGYLWALFAFRPHATGITTLTLDANFVDDLYARMRTEGTSPDHRHHQVALMVFAMNNDGESALRLLHTHVLPGIARMQADMTQQSVIEHLSVEMKMYAMLAFARHPIVGDVRGVDGEKDGDMAQQRGNEELFDSMRRTAAQLLRHSQDSRAVLSVDQQLFEAFCVLCGKSTGAASEAFAVVKSVIATGCALTPRMLNHMLLANANSSAVDGGSAYLSEDILGLYSSTNHGEGLPTQQTFHAIGAAIDRHGVTPRIEGLRDQLVQRATAYAMAVSPDIEERVLRSLDAEGGGVSLSRSDLEAILECLPVDEDIAVPVIPVHLLRRHFVPNTLRKRDMDLKKYSQYVHYKTAPNVTTRQVARPLKEFEHSPDSMTTNV